jgi:probable HAF family extracellular repeat protein
MLLGCLVALAFVALGRESNAAEGEPLSPMQELPPLTGHTFSEAYGINNAGRIVGVSSPTAGVSPHAVMWSDGVVHDLGLTLETPPATPNDEGPLLRAVAGAIARAVNARGHIVGFTQNPGRAFIYKGGNLVNLGRLEVGRGSQAFGINDNDEVVGRAGITVDGLLRNRAVLFRDGLVVDLGTLPGGTDSLAVAINNSGQIVGQSNKSLGGDPVPVLWEDGQIIELAAPPGFGLAQDINESGRIAGIGGGVVEVGDLLPLVWEPPYPNTVTQLPPLSTSAPPNSCPMGYEGSANGLNAHGEIIGGLGLNPVVGQPTVVAAYWQNHDAEPICLGTLGGSASLGRKINNRGGMVGISRTATGDDHAFVVWRHVRHQ